MFSFYLNYQQFISFGTIKVLTNGVYWVKTERSAQKDKTKVKKKFANDEAQKPTHEFEFRAGKF